MADFWFPQARTIDVGPGGSMVGGPSRVTHHTTEGGSIDGAVATYRQTGDYPTFTINYAADDVVQHFPANQSATALMHQGDPQTNRMGNIHIQIEWIGQASQPFTSGVTAGPKVRAFFDWVRSLGIPDTWPMGAPPDASVAYGIDNGHRDTIIWSSQAGHYTHSQVPGNYHADAGAIDPNFVKQTSQNEDDMPSIADTQKMLDAMEARLTAALVSIHADHVVMYHGDKDHPNSIDGLHRDVVEVIHGDAAHTHNLDSIAAALKIS